MKNDIEEMFDNWLKSSGLKEEDFLKFISQKPNIRFIKFSIPYKDLPQNLKTETSLDNRFFSVSLGYGLSSFTQFGVPFMLDVMHAEQSTDCALFILLVAQKIDNYIKTLPAFMQSEQRAFDVAKAFIKKNIPLYMS